MITPADTRRVAGGSGPITFLPLLLQRKDSSKDLEAAVQQVFQKFSGSLQKILEDIDKCATAAARPLPSGSRLPAS